MSFTYKKTTFTINGKDKDVPKNVEKKFDKIFDKFNDLFADFGKIMEDVEKEEKSE